MKGIIYFGAIAVIFVLALGDAFATKPSDEYQSNGLVLAAPMDTDIKRSVMNGTNNIIGAEMKVCEDRKPEKTCKKWKKKGKCTDEKVAKVCKKTCDLCQDDCHDTLESLHCLRECPTPVPGSDPSNYHHILGRCYYFEATPMNFTDAMENCKTIFGNPGGRLFEPRNSEVNDAVAKKGQTIANNPEGSEWIGMEATPLNLTEIDNPVLNLLPKNVLHHFYYLSGGPFTSLPYGQWAIGEPNNSEDIENCVQIYTRGTVDKFRWNDIRCDREFPSICEMGHEVIW